MALPFFYFENLADKAIELDEETSKHIISVLRMPKGGHILLTDGKGNKATAIITDDNRKRCIVQATAIETVEKSEQEVCIAISIIKNTARFEWFLEKATEIGIQEIIPMLCDRTEREKFRYDRMKNILISAMLQSQQAWLPVLHEPTNYNAVIATAAQPNKFIAHCLPANKVRLSIGFTQKPAIILIGPEGDFTEKEIAAALQNNYQPVSLGQTRLRTETAGLVAATLLKF